MIAVCVNPFRDNQLSCTKRCLAILQGMGFPACVTPVFAEEGWQAPEGLPVRELSNLREDLSHAIVLGGDGTILAVVRALQVFEVPIIGVNLGTVGFMTALEPDEISLLPQALKPDAPISCRMMLKLALQRDGETILQDSALNDIVVHGYGECIRPTAWSDGVRMFSFSGDGLIAATPTGSTGYSLSAGGPIVEPDARAILLTPICAHTLSAKPYVLSPDRTVTILTEKLTGRRAYLAVDGYTVADLESGDRLIVTCSEHIVKMIELGNRNFYSQLEKLV